MPRFDPLPDTAARDRRRRILRHRRGHRNRACGPRLSGRPGRTPGREIHDIVGKINADGGEAIGCHLDVTDPIRSKPSCTRPPKQLGDIEVLVTGAGDTYFGKLHEINTESSSRSCRSI